MDNRFKKVEYFEIEYHELDDIINSIYPDIDFECALDKMNDSCVSYSIDGILNEYDEQELLKLLEGEPQEYNSEQILLNDMCRKGLIEKGNYLINISW